ARLPLPERFDLPQETIDAIAETRRRGGRVVAVGTSVVRALEGAWLLGHGVLRAGEDTTELRIDRTHRRRVVDGLLTGVHDPSASHFELLGAFLDDNLQSELLRAAESKGFLTHEFGDTCL